VIAILAGLVLLVGGGELLVRGASRLAAAFGVAPLVVGLTVVAFGTSAPELAVSLQAVAAGAGDLALGNVLGSNIFNVLAILGLSALVAPLVVSKRVVQVEVPVMIAISAGTWALAANGRLGVADGALLLLTIAAYTGWLLRSSNAEQDDDARDAAPGGRFGMAALIVVGLGLLMVGARLLVEGASALARGLGVSDAVIGLTIVAAGTSLPEVAASVVATYRGQRDIAVGNVLGSNVFNLTMILGAAAVSGGGLAVSSAMLQFDFAVMFLVAVACLPIFWTGHRITRWEGVLFLAGYLAYVAWLVQTA
jgi:cation:H+ antiporter